MSVPLISFLKPYLEPLSGSLTWASLSGALTSVLTALVSVALYRLYLHPLAHVPGPILAQVTSLWLHHEAYRGREASTLEALHKEYGKVVRIGPNEVNINDGAALHPIYVKNGGFEKNPCYRNLNIDDVATIFSDTSNAHRASRAKAVVSMFSAQAIRNGRETVLRAVEQMADRLESKIKSAAGKPIDLLALFRNMSTDASTGYLFHRPFGVLNSDDSSASEMVDFIIASAKWFYMPNLAFKALEAMRANFEANWGPERYKVWKALARTDQYVAKLVKDALESEGTDEEDTYQARLLRVGVSREEIIAQCKDVMAAGTDTMAQNLATIAFRLAQSPKKYDRLRREVLENPDADPQRLPYLSGVVKEGLRLSMTTPNRFPRIVAADGLQVPGLPFIPTGTSVACCVWCLHLDPTVFPDPHAFEPERWLQPTDQMRRDLIPFGSGPRQCIARNLATATLHWAVQTLVRRDLLAGATTVRDRIEILQWFASRVQPDGRVELVWKS